MKISNIPVLLSFVLPSIGLAQIAVTYNFDTLDDAMAPSLVEGAHFTPSAFGYSGTGTFSIQSGTGGTSSYAASANGWNIPGNYFTFSIALDPGYVFQATQLSFDGRVTSTGPTDLEVFSSANDFATSIHTFPPESTGSFDPYIVDLSEVGLVANTFEIRIHGNDASLGAGTFRVDNATLTGTITAVPEPSAVACCIGIAVLIPLVWNRSRKQVHNSQRTRKYRS